MLHRQVQIRRELLLDDTAIHGASMAEKMSWASRRQTTRVEDEAYCLLGLFGVSMPTIYGAGQKAYLRLQEEMLRKTPNH